MKTKLEKRVHFLGVYAIASTLVLTVLLIGFVCLHYFEQSVHSESKVTFFESLRTRSIIVEDENGNDRVVISPTISSTKTRQRTDTISGVLILDEKGIDRTVLGATPTFQRAQKIVTRQNNGYPYGVVFNNEKGDERGGFGYYSDRQVASLGLDSSVGEGIALFVAEDSLFGQKLGLIMNERGQRVYLGSNKTGEVVFNLDSPRVSRLETIVDLKGKTTIKYFDLVKNTNKVVFRSK